MPDAGFGALHTERGNLPLDSVDVRATVTGLAAGVEVTQGFRNPFDVPLEATYVFPLPDRAAVTALRLEAADRVVDGTLKERGEARAEYTAAIAAGQRAAIAEEDRPDVFTMRVGNILPGERVTVRLGLDQPLPYEDGSATFRFPLVVAPRYVPGTPLPGGAAGDGVVADTDAVPDASRISPPVLLPGFPNPVRLSLSVEIDPAGLPLAGTRSSLHLVTADSGGGRTTLRLQPGERLDRDFILRIDFGAPEETVALALLPDESPAGDGADGNTTEGTFTLTVLPGAEAAAPRPRDVVLLLDRSGSMGGWKMIAARRAAARIVDTLTSADRLAVFSFDHVVERPRELGGGLVEATDRNRFRAVEHLAALTARGGTVLLEPLQQAVGLLGDSPGRDRVLVLITDGQVGNEDQILAAIEPALGGVRIHAVGIDRAVNAGFLGRLASIGRGRFELVESEDRLDQAMEHIHDRIGAPLVTDLSLDWSGMQVLDETVEPNRLNALFPGVPLVISGRYRGGTGGARVSVRGRTADGTPWECRSGNPAPGSASAGRLWARAHLRELEDRYAIGGGPDLERQIVDISLRFGVLCRFTAFVAVDSRVVTDGTGPHQVIQPVEYPSGWAGPESAGAMPMAVPASYGGAMPMSQSGGPPPVPAGIPPIPPMPAPGGMPPTPAMPAPAGPPPAMAPPPMAPPAPGGPPPRSRPGGGGSRSRRAAEQAPALGGTAPPPQSGGVPAGPSPQERALAEIHRRLRDELDRLAESTSASVGERWRELSDLRTRLTAMVTELAGAGVPAERYAPLTALAAELAVADDNARWATDLPALWSRTTRVLTDFTNPSPEQPPALQPFWKRRP
ncbi:trypsin [Actinomadura craniellae]|uniref:Trypsin n=2 Tax=Actinomadura craniellae TaxID=2231787 RepID=A0A365H8Q2_9ACTN|nr:trypsin [Actinomadura craniellae]